MNLIPVPGTYFVHHTPSKRFHGPLDTISHARAYRADMVKQGIATEAEMITLWGTMPEPDQAPTKARGAAID
jgi:hypothetical protein